MGTDGRDPAPLLAVKPFLLLSSRPEEEAADEEHASFLQATRLPAGRLHRIRMDAGPLPALDLDDYAGVFLGGGPFNSSDPAEDKSPVQVRVEEELGALLDEVVERDLPFLGACYGIGTLGTHQGGVVDRVHAEPVSCVPIQLTPAGVADPLLAGMPASFDALVGHKEACRVLPPSAVLLATSAGCPVQMFRVGQNVYATQFHPELDVPGILTRVAVYRDAGYFPPESLAALQTELARHRVTQPPALVRRFVELYAR